MHLLAKFKALFTRRHWNATDNESNRIWPDMDSANSDTSEDYVKEQKKVRNLTFDEQIEEKIKAFQTLPSIR